MILATFLGGLAFFLYGQVLVEKNLQKTNSRRLRTIFKLFTKHRITALFFGSLITVGTQSSAATVVTLVNFINTGVLQLNQAIGLVLGASLGTTLVVQIISFNIGHFALWFIVIGFLIKRIRSSSLLIGLGFIFYGIYLMGNSITVFKVTHLGKEILAGIGIGIIPTLTGAFLLTVICQSTLLPLAVGIILIRDGGVSLVSVIPIILGSHIGASVLPLITSFRSSSKNLARQLTLANLGYRLCGSLIFLPLIVPLAGLSQWITGFSESALVSSRQLANAHTIFTILTIGFFLPFIRPYTRFIKKLVPEKALSEKKLLYLNSQLENSPSVILPAAKKEIEKLIGDVCRILSDAVSIWELDNLRNIKKIEREYESIHIIKNSISRYITGLRRELLTEEQYKEEMRLLGILDNLGKIGELVGRNIVDIAARRITQGLSFSIEGLNELLNIHRGLLDEFMFFPKGAKEGKTKELGSVIQASHDAHIERMHKGFFETQETSSLHLDAITVFERIHDHIQKIATTMTNDKMQMTGFSPSFRTK